MGHVYPTLVGMGYSRRRSSPALVGMGYSRRRSSRATGRIRPVGPRILTTSHCLVRCRDLAKDATALTSTRHGPSKWQEELFSARGKHGSNDLYYSVGAPPRGHTTNLDDWAWIAGKKGEQRGTERVAATGQ